MRTLELDFQRRSLPSLPGWLLLAGGLSLAGLAGAAHLSLEADRAQQAEQLHRVEQQLQAQGLSQAPMSASESRARETDLMEMGRITAQMNLPWEGLFEMLEIQPRADIALLGLTPDARKGQLRITAEARDLAAMLAFHRSLEASEALSDVSLLSHEVVAEQAEQPVRFNLLAVWGVKHARP